jgi:hypothetical protein
MDSFKMAIVAMALTDTDGGPRDVHGQRRELTAEELAELADFGWHIADVKGFVARCVNAVRHFSPGQIAKVKNGQRLPGFPAATIAPVSPRRQLVPIVRRI